MSHPNPFHEESILLDRVNNLAVVYFDARGVVTGWSTGARRIFGHTEGEAIGQFGSFLFTEEDQNQEAFQSMMSEVREQGQIEQERWRVRRNRTQFWSNETMISLTEGEQIKGFALLSRDSTEKKLSVDQVEEARRKAETLSRAKSRFIENMSNELRTPLGIMLGFAQLLKDPRESIEEKEKFTQIILNNGQHLSRLVNDILDISKIETSRFEAEKVDFFLGEFLSDILAMARLQAEEKGIELAVTTEGPIPRKILTDPGRLRQILLTLIKESIKATDAGLVELRVRSASSAQTHTSMILEFEVHETGIALRDEEVTELFQPVSLEERAGYPRFSEPAMGIYLSRRLAQALGGDLVLKHRTERRSSFVVTIDAGPFETDVTFYTDAAITEGKKETVLQGIRVLMVDDSADNRLLVQKMLEIAQANVKTVESGLQALEAVQNDHFDVILLDVQMPEMDGYQTFKRLSEMGFEQPVIALTAHALPSEREHSLAMGFAGHLSKPIDRQLLYETLLRLARPTRKGRPRLVALKGSY